MLLVKTRLGSSPIHGLGLFADQFIPNGTSIWQPHETFDVHFDQDTFESLPELTRSQISHYLYRCVDSGQYVLCADDARFMNHSEKPNTVNGRSGHTVACRDIAPGEELTCDYFTFDLDADPNLRK